MNSIRERSRLVISVVSHGHGPLLASTLDDLVAYAPSDAPIVVTLNIPEREPFDRGRWSPRVVWRENTHSRGFGANHNAALTAFDAEWYAIVNPDIRLRANLFASLMSAGDADLSTALVAPAIIDSHNALQDSARALPTPSRVLYRALLRALNRVPRPDENREWYAGMFMLIRASAFRAVGGFDERYFLYSEDADLCARLRLAGYRLLLHSGIRAIHDAQRTSHRSFKHLRWHVESLVRLWLSPTFWRYRRLLASERAMAGSNPVDVVSEEPRER